MGNRHSFLSLGVLVLLFCLFYCNKNVPAFYYSHLIKFATGCFPLFFFSGVMIRLLLRKFKWNLFPSGQSRVTQSLLPLIEILFPFFSPLFSFPVLSNLLVMHRLGIRTHVWHTRTSKKNIIWIALLFFCFYCVEGFFHRDNCRLG